MHVQSPIKLRHIGPESNGLSLFDNFTALVRPIVKAKTGQNQWRSTGADIGGGGGGANVDHSNLRFQSLMDSWYSMLGRQGRAPQVRSPLGGFYGMPP